MAPSNTVSPIALETLVSVTCDFIYPMPMKPSKVIPALIKYFCCGTGMKYDRMKMMRGSKPTRKMK